MSTHVIKKTTLAFICILLVISVCSCTGLNMDSIMQEINNIQQFIADIQTAVNAASDESLTNDQKIECVEKLIHPKSEITLESIENDLKTNEKLKEIKTVNTANIVDMPTVDELINMIQYNEELGGNIYHTEIGIDIDGVIITIDLTLLSDSAGMGIYNYEIK